MTAQRCVLAARSGRSEGGVEGADAACQALRGLWVRVLARPRRCEGCSDVELRGGALTWRFRLHPEEGVKAG